MAAGLGREPGLCHLSGPFLPGQNSEAPRDQLSEPLRGFLQRYLGGMRFGPDKTTRVSAVSVPIKAGQDEIIVYVAGRSWCGSGGCTLFVLRLARLCQSCITKNSPAS